jgi:hypothetical protein
MVLSQMSIVCWRAARSWADSWAANRSTSVSKSNWPLPWTTISSMNGLCRAGSSTVATWIPRSR